jgi:hypothetical protein
MENKLTFEDAMKSINNYGTDGERAFLNELIPEIAKSGKALGIFTDVADRAWQRERIAKDSVTNNGYKSPRKPKNSPELERQIKEGQAALRARADEYAASVRAAHANA